jgi:WD40 repeat protein
MHIGLLRHLFIQSNNTHCWFAPVHYHSLPSTPFYINNTMMKQHSRGLQTSWSPMLLAFGGHDLKVKSISFSLDGTCILSGSVDKTLCMWDAESGVEILAPILEHNGKVLCVTFSPDGTLIASGPSNNTIRV